MNPLFMSDSYKLSHKFMSIPGTQYIYSNLTFRFDKYFSKYYPNFDHKAVWFGLQAFIKKTLIKQWNEEFFNKPKAEVLNELKLLTSAFAMTDFSHFEALHDLGYLPIEIKSLPEGSLVNMGTPALTIVNTHPDFQWLTNYLESVLSAEIWKPTTVATIGREFRNLSNKWALKTTGSIEGTDFQNHDFGYRGTANTESSAACGAGFLLSTLGTDNIPAIDFVGRYYNTDVVENPVAFSIPAGEHSVTTLGINYYNAEDKQQGELEYLKWLLTEVQPSGLFSYVADSYDYWGFLEHILPTLKDIIMSRDGKYVVRPDCYSDDTSILTPNGWKLFKDLTDNDLVAQVLDNGTYEFVKPLKKQVYNYDGNMYHFTDSKGKLDILVTPDHRMIYQQINRQTKEIKEVIKFAKDFPKNNQHNYYFERSAKAKDQNKSLTLDERLNIAFQADGSYCTNSKTNIRFNFSKERKIERLKSILDLTDYEYKIYNLADGRVEININVQDSSKFYKHFNWVNKENLCSNWCEEFLEELKHWDSSVRNEGRFKYDTTNKSCIEIIELIALSAGKGVLITHTEDDRSEKYSDIYTANILDYNTIGGQSWKINEVLYKGKVYCVQVPTGRLLVKRNRCTLVCGNSGHVVDVICGKEFTDYSDEPTLYSAALRFAYDLENEENNFEGVILYQKQYYKISISVTRNKLGLIDNYIVNRIDEYDLTVEDKGTVEWLYDIFGGTKTEQGYKLLDPHIGMIYGDGITYERAEQIFNRLHEKGFASTNVVFGIGSWTMNQVSRDSLGIAVKATNAIVDGKQIPIYKQPKTDSTKNSAKGLLKVIKNEDGSYTTLNNVTVEEEQQGELVSVFKDGKLLREQTFEEIRNLIWK